MVRNSNYIQRNEAYQQRRELVLGSPYARPLSSVLRDAYSAVKSTFSARAVELSPAGLPAEFRPAIVDARGLILRDNLDDNTPGNVLAPISGSLDTSIRTEVTAAEDPTAKVETAIQKYLKLHPAPADNWKGKIGNFFKSGLKALGITGELAVMANFPYVGAMLVPFGTGALATLIVGGLVGVGLPLAHLTYIVARGISRKRAIKNLYQEPTSVTAAFFLESLKRMQAEGKNINSLLKVFEDDVRAEILSRLKEITKPSIRTVSAPNTQTEVEPPRDLSEPGNTRIPSAITILLGKEFSANTIDEYRETINAFVELKNFQRNNWPALDAAQRQTLDECLTRLVTTIKSNKLPEYKIIVADGATKDRPEITYASLPSTDTSKRSVIGGGGMAVVYRVIDLEDGKIYALKENKFKAAGSEELTRRFKLEIETHKRILNEPGVVKLHSYRENQGYFVMEYKDSSEGWGTLDKLDLKFDSASRTRSLKLLFDIAIKVSAVLGRVYGNHKICHCDLTPANVFIRIKPGDEVEVEIADWGLARHLGRTKNTSTGVLAGTHALMAPIFVTKYGRIGSGDLDAEKQKEVRYLSVINDLYGLGGTLYRIITKYYPIFKGEGKAFRISGDPKTPDEYDLGKVIADYVTLETAHANNDQAGVDRIKAKYTLVQKSSTMSGFAGHEFDVDNRIYEILTKLIAIDERDNPFKDNANPMVALNKAFERLQSEIFGVGTDTTALSGPIAPSTEDRTKPNAAAPSAPARVVSPDAPGIPVPPLSFLAGPLAKKLVDLKTLADQVEDPAKALPDKTDVLLVRLDLLEDQIKTDPRYRETVDEIQYVRLLIKKEGEE